MKNKKLLFLLLVTLIIILTLLYFIINKFRVDNTKTSEEYTPEQEISDSQLRETIVTLYFLDKNTNTLKSEGKLIDSVLLLQNPYKELVSLLIAGPTSSNLCNVFPENTKVLDAYIENDLVTIDFSDDILNFESEEQKFNIINSVLNTLCELNEVNAVKFLVNNEQNKIFNDKFIH